MRAVQNFPTNTDLELHPESKKKTYHDNGSCSACRNSCCGRGQAAGGSSPKDLLEKKKKKHCIKTYLAGYIAWRTGTGNCVIRPVIRLKSSGEVEAGNCLGWIQWNHGTHWSRLQFGDNERRAHRRTLHPVSLVI